MKRCWTTRETPLWTWK